MADMASSRARELRVRADCVLECGVFFLGNVGGEFCGGSRPPSEPVVGEEFVIAR
jgi:hypothetical protein